MLIKIFKKKKIKMNLKNKWIFIIIKLISRLIMKKNLNHKWNKKLDLS